jgi:hypothetical protein
MFNSLQPLLRSTRPTFIEMVLVVLFGFVGQAYSQCSSPANAIVAENCLTGNDPTGVDA